MPDLIDLIARTASREELVTLLRETEKQRQQLAASVEWALGQRDDFATRGPKDGPYWWRTELRKRSGL